MNCPTCDLEMQKRIVVKEGSNKGRPFWSCQDQSCKGFKWADTPEKETKRTPVNGDQQKSIIRQHSQEMALRLAELHKMNDASMEKLTTLIDWFADDAVGVKKEQVVTANDEPPLEDFSS